MQRRFPIVRALVGLAVLAALVGGVVATRTLVARAATSSCAGDVGATALMPTLGGAADKIEVPTNWNGTLLLYSHGYVFPGTPVQTTDVGDPLTGATLL